LHEKSHNQESVQTQEHKVWTHFEDTIDPQLSYLRQVQLH